MAKQAVNFRWTPEIKKLADQIAKLEHRTTTNLLEILVLERAKMHGIEIRDSSA